MSSDEKQKPDPLSDEQLNAKWAGRLPKGHEFYRGKVRSQRGIDRLKRNDEYDRRVREKVSTK